MVNETEPILIEVVEDENLTPEAMRSVVCNEPCDKVLSINYSTQRKAAKRCGLPASGKLAINLHYCVESPALSNAFVVKGVCGDDLRVEGTIFVFRAKKGYGKFAAKKISEMREVVSR